MAPLKIRLLHCINLLHVRQNTIIKSLYTIPCCSKFVIAPLETPSLKKTVPCTFLPEIYQIPIKNSFVKSLHPMSYLLRICQSSTENPVMIVCIMFEISHTFMVEDVAFTQSRKIRDLNSVISVLKSCRLNVARNRNFEICRN